MRALDIIIRVQPASSFFDTFNGDGDPKMHEVFDVISVDDLCVVLTISSQPLSKSSADLAFE